MNIAKQIATELAVKEQQVSATIALLDQGDTVPFIARYRKEVTSGLDDIQLRKLDERLDYLRQLEQRRTSIIQSIDQQGLLDSPLKNAIEKCSSKTELEDLYLPFKPKRNSKASIAKAAGLAPLAKQLISNNSVNPEYIAKDYIDTKLGIDNTAQALQGAEHILQEQLCENALLLGQLRHWLKGNGILSVAVKRGKNDPQSKFRDYFDYSQALKDVPSHRALAVFRGIKESILKLSINPPTHNERYPVKLIEHQLGLSGARRNQDYWLKQLALHSWQQKLQSQLESDLAKSLRESAESDSIEVFATNLSDLLMAAPAGQKVTMGLDPGLRSGVKVAVLSATGTLLAQAVIYPHAPQKQWQQAIDKLRALVDQYKVELISIGNGTASRETEQLAKALAEQTNTPFNAVVVSEAGASVYSASELASIEFPDIDVSIRGAISIARRLQDPLAELVKIDPKAIGVGQYQHDVNQKSLNLKLEAVVEDCVNKVGVNLNSASQALLTQVAGINSTIAKNIIAARDEKGKFSNRTELLKVPRLGAKAYQQCAGFLRIDNSAQPLDNSAVHPESYPLVAKMAHQAKVTSSELIGNQTLLNSLSQHGFSDEKYGAYTVADTLAELAKPGRDPRPEFETVTFDESVNDIKDVQEHMQLQGVVTNVTNFGAFVDIGVHQDGLVHISQLANQFVKDPHAIVKTGQIVQVRVLEVDVQRKRLSLSMKD